MRKNAALGRLKHHHYALFVKVVSSAFSWADKKWHLIWRLKKILCLQAAGHPDNSEKGLA